MKNKYIYFFGECDDSSLIGGKGAGLSIVHKLGLPVPNGFTITTDLCNYYFKNNNSLPDSFREELSIAMKKLETITGKIFAGNNNPLLISVRSGSKASMPGMMDSILNLGINEQICEVLAKQTSEIFANDCYERFLKNHSKNLPTDLYEQLQYAIIEVIRSWMSNRAKAYRQIHNIPESLGTAVNIQSMVFGNMNNNSATGVVFTRSPSTGEKRIFGEILFNAQGEDIVAGTNTPNPIISADPQNKNTMQHLMPLVFDELVTICSKLENHFKDAQDIEFTIEDSKLYILQTRKAQRSIAASVKTAVDMCLEGLISKQEALLRIDTNLLYQLLHSRINENCENQPLSSGIPASPGVATGKIVFSCNLAKKIAQTDKVILLRSETSAEDIEAMHIAEGILTARGGATCHAAVVSRGMGIPCVCGTSSVTIDEENKIAKLGEVTLKEEDIITIDGSTGKIFLGLAPLIEPKMTVEFATLLSWADELSEMKIYANAETIQDTTKAMEFGARGVGLCRTEHMFFDESKIHLMREMILSQNIDHRRDVISKLLPLTIQDFKSLFKIVKDKPINIRLLDPPLHEFLPKHEYSHNIARETNPMLGHRGCRVGITYPEIYEMQVEAIFRAMQQTHVEENITTNLELMIPFISTAQEIKILKLIICNVVERLELEYERKFDYKIGTMIELPRAALIADKLAAEVDFFSFGTNDLTQTTFGISRDDGASFISSYMKNKIFSCDPFASIDETGVGELISMAVTRGRNVKPLLKISVCGEHAGDPKSIEFFHKIGIDHISCSPYRISIAKIAAAQAKLKT